MKGSYIDLHTHSCLSDGSLRPMELLRAARDAGMLYLLLTGGEPFLWPDFWTLYDELIDMGFIQIF